MTSRHERTTAANLRHEARPATKRECGPARASGGGPWCWGSAQVVVRRARHPLRSRAARWMCPRSGARG